MTRPRLNIGLLWHSLSSDNLGVGALTESQIAIAKRAAERAGVNVTFTVFGTSGSRTALNHAPEIVVGDRLSLKRMLVGKTRYLAQMRACDIILDIGEGDSFTDIYGLERFRMQAFAKGIVLAQGKPMILSPQTIGPFNGKWTRRIAATLMRRCARVYTRDIMSTEYLQELGISQNTGEAIDVAFRLPFTKRQMPANGRTRVGINISGLLYHGGYSGSNQFGLSVNYRELTDRLIAHFANDDRCEVHLIGHVITDFVGREDDYSVSKKIAEQYPHTVLAEKFASPSDAKGYIASMDYFMGARMHACIAAFSAGVPVMPIAYSRKFQGLFSTLGYDPIVDCAAMTTDDAFARIIDGFDRRERLAVQTKTGTQVAFERLQGYEDYLVQSFNRIGHA